jgi:cation diffusion facilitator family transporter
MAASSRKVIIAALIGNSLIAVTKFIAATMTASSAMLSEGIHSLVDTGNQVLLLLGLKRAEKPADERFPFGHGKEIYFWSFVVAILIFAVGAGISLFKGFDHLIHPTPIKNPFVNYVVLGLAMIFEGYSWSVARREFIRYKGRLSTTAAVSRAKDPIIFVVYFEDTAAMAGLVAAFFGVLAGHLTGNPIYDGMASIVIGIILAATAIWLAYETKSLLIGEAAEPEIVASIREMTGRIDEVECVNEILTLHMGPEFILVTMSVDFVDDVPAGEVEKVLEELDRQVKMEHSRVKRVFVEPRSRLDCTTPEQPGASG